MEPPREVSAGQAVALAIDHGEWRGIAVLVAEQAGWTVFEDLTGYLVAIPIDEWLRLAGRDDLVFAGYNDAIWSGELIVLKEGQVVREFREAAEAPEENVNRGRLESETDTPIRDWIDASDFVDNDELSCGLLHGTLWAVSAPTGTGEGIAACWRRPCRLRAGRALPCR